MFRPVRMMPIAVCVILFLICTGMTSPLCAQETESDLLATLQKPDASLFEKGLACKRLAVVGTEAAVPVLASLLDDDDLAHYARYGLEPIPSPKVDAAFREALSRLKGKHLVGVIHSMANRGKPEAIPALAEKLSDADSAVAIAAAHSVGRLGTAQGAQTLLKNLRPDFAEACLVCAKTLIDQKQPDLAQTVLDELAELNGVPEHLRLAAVLQSLVLQGERGEKRLTSLLASEDQDDFVTGLRAARLIPAATAASAALAAMNTQPAVNRTAPLLTLLGDLGEPAGRPAVVQQLDSPEPVVRIAAFKALASLGSERNVPALLDASSDPNEGVAHAAQTALASLSGSAIDQALIAALNNPGRQAAAVRAIGQRRCAQAVPQLLKLIDGPHQLDVLAALGETIPLEQLDVLGSRLEAKPSELQEAVRKAFHAACYRMPNRDATASQIARYLQNASDDTVQFLMEELRQLASPKALEIVARSAHSSRDVEKDYATRALGEWLDTSAASVLLDLAKSEGTSKYGIRALRGYIRLARQFTMPANERLVICRNALAIAERPDEKKLVLDVLQRYPSADGLEMAVHLAETPELKAAATRTALVIVENVGGKSPKVRQLLSQIGFEPMKIQIVKAEYGAKSKFKDVTNTLRKHVRGFPLIVLPAPRYNKAFGGDPAPGVPKVLRIEYHINGKAERVTLSENAPVLLPVPE